MSRRALALSSLPKQHWLGLGAFVPARPPARPPAHPPPQVAAIHLTPEPFSVENGMLTPTFKLKRQQAQAAFQPAIDEMYARLPGGLP